MNNIDKKVLEIHTALLDIIGDVLQYDLSGDQIKSIQDKKYEVVKALFALQDKIKGEIDAISGNK